VGVQEVQGKFTEVELRRFTKRLLRDLQALDEMISNQLFEVDIRRVGAEQELFLIDDCCQPAPTAIEILEDNTDPRLVTELTRFNLEFNLSPHVFGGLCLSDMEAQLNEMLAHTRELAARHDTRVVLTGILPTIHLSDLGLDNLTPKPRYYALNEALMNLRDGPAQFQIRGPDELFFRHNSILVEGCNTSFQTHFQVAPDEFANLYNIAQVVAGPVLAAACNSPVLFGKRLWHETRIALFQQAVDTRSSNLYLREMSPRVHFGTDWVDSPLDIYREDIARFRVILTADDEDPFEALARGDIPGLKALQLHNGTVYRWNRPCYGVINGKPHLRIENRILPAGPTVVDEVANAAFWFGLVSGLSAEVPDVRERIAFDDAKSNFVAAARLGLHSQLTWLDEQTWPADELVRDILLPIAHDGLSRSGVDAADADRYLGILRDRMSGRRTGAQWILESLARMKRGEPSGTRADRLNAVVAGMVSRQESGKPGHEWTLATLSEVPSMRSMQGTRVEHFMTTDLFTVYEDELVELVAAVMDWRRIRHILVEDRKGQLVGLVTHRGLLRYVSESSRSSDEDVTPVRDIMIRNPITVTSDTRTMDAIHLMRERKISALPVLQDGNLVGIITEKDFYRIAGELLDDSMTGADVRR